MTQGNLNVDSINNKDITNGLVVLDNTGCVPLSEINPAILSAMLWRGVWNSETNTPPLTSGVGRSGDFFAVGKSSSGIQNIDGITEFNNNDLLLFNGEVWQIIRDNNSVLSVNNKTGTVTITKSDVGLGLVNNTPDNLKPVSQATQTALNLKVDKAEGKELSSNDFTNEAKVKLQSLQNFSGKASDVTLNTDPFTQNLPKSITDVQRLAESVDKLQSNGTVPSGTVFHTLAPNVPGGYYELDGRQLFEDTDPALFNMFKSGTTAFLPDARGQFIRAVNNRNVGIDPYRQLGSSQMDAFQGHTHMMQVKLDTRASGGARDFWSADSSNLSRKRELEFETLMQPEALQGYGALKVANETRPTNIAMRIIIKR